MKNVKKAKDLEVPAKQAREVKGGEGFVTRSSAALVTGPITPRKKK